jgi:hypothetical protein
MLEWAIHLSMKNRLSALDSKDGIFTLETASRFANSFTINLADTFGDCRLDGANYPPKKILHVVRRKHLQSSINKCTLVSNFNER